MGTQHVEVAGINAQSKGQWEYLHGKRDYTESVVAARAPLCIARKAGLSKAKRTRIRERALPTCPMDPAAIGQQNCEGAKACKIVLPFDDSIQAAALLAAAAALASTIACRWSRKRTTEGLGKSKCLSSHTKEPRIASPIRAPSKNAHSSCK